MSIIVRQPYCILSTYVYSILSTYAFSLYIFETWTLLHRNFPINRTTDVRHMYLRKRHMRIKELAIQKNSAIFCVIPLFRQFYDFKNILTSMFDTWSRVWSPSAAIYFPSENRQICSQSAWISVFYVLRGGIIVR